MEKDYIKKLFTPILGEDIFTQSSDIQKYQKGYRYGDGLAAAVLRPKNDEQICQILHICNEKNIKIIPQGGNTGLVGASVPDKSGNQIVLSTELLNKDIFELDIENMSLNVGAGFVLDDINQKLESHNLFLSIDIGSSGTCNVGGLLATNAAGTRAARYGAAKHHVMSYKVVHADGILKEYNYKHINNQMQDNGHIDFENPFLGSQGTLGIITSAKLKLTPKPTCSESFILVPNKMGDIAKIRNYLKSELGDELTAFEGMNEYALKMVAKHIPHTKYLLENMENAHYALLVEISLNKKNATTDQINSIITEHFENLMTENLVINGLYGKTQEYWHIRHHISEAIKKEGQIIATDIAVKNPDDLHDFVKNIELKLQNINSQIKIAIFGHEALGALHFNLVCPKETMQPISEEQKKQIQHLVYSTIINEYHGTFSAEHGVGLHNQWAYDEFVCNDEKQKYAKLKQKYDPNNILNPNVNYGA